MSDVKPEDEISSLTMPDVKPEDEISSLTKPDVKPEDEISSLTMPLLIGNQERKKCSEVEKACEDIIATRYHDPKRAVTLVNELCSKHGDNSLVQFTRGQVLGFYYSHLPYTNKNRIKILKDAIDSLKQAVKLEPTRPELRYSLAVYSFKLAKCNNEGYDEIVQECERALSLDVFNVISREDHPEKKLLEETKAELENMILKVKAEAEMVDLDTSIHNMSDLRRAELVNREIDRELDRALEIVKKAGEYWRRLSYEEKCRILEVKVEDVESFYSSGKNKDLRSLRLLKEAVDLYREKRQWISWSCCLCKEDRKKEDYDVWTSIEKHIDDHFDGHESKTKGICDYEIFGKFDSVVFNNGVFIMHNCLHEQLITKELFDAPISNNRFLWDAWVNSDVERVVEAMKNKRAQISQSMSLIYEKLQKMKKNMKGPLEKGQTEKQKAAEDSDTINSDEIRAWERIETFKVEAMYLSTYDYRELLLPLLKSFILSKIERGAEEKARIDADSVMAELINEELQKNKDILPKPKTNKEKKRERIRNLKEITGQVGVKSEESQSSTNDDNRIQEGEIKEQMQQEIQAPDALDEQGSPSSSMQRTTILFGSFPVTVYFPEKEQEK